MKAEPTKFALPPCVAAELGGEQIRTRLPLGQSQSYQIQKALDLYHYINPKLLLLTAAVRLALRGEPIKGHASQTELELIERGCPANMYPMEMVSDKPDDRAIRRIYKDIQRTLSLSSINSDYRTLALWPDYLAAAWSGLKPLVQRPAYPEACDRLRATAREQALALPYAIDLSMEQVKELGEDEEVLEKTESFEKLLPGLIINIALLELDWRAAEPLARSPFPARRREY